MASLLRNAIRANQRSCLCLSQRFLSVSNSTFSPKSSEKAALAASQSGQKLIVSDSCIKRLKQICQDGSFLRITVEGGGCSGFQYKFDLDSKVNEDDLQFGKDDAKVIIDSVSMEYCNGATIDYHTELIRAGFRILANPKAEQGCSCGSSFAIKMD